ncbi:MAG: SPOR domain-containing protein [Alphaproteobacteria bacterium]|nr:SPOR domain-containing protein [Alphaproteobacteria bacterium]
MDEFDKIREFSEDITKRKEPSLLNTQEQSNAPMQESDDASLYNFKPDFVDRLGEARFDDLEEKSFSSMKLHFVAFGIFAGVLTIALAGFFMFGSDTEGTNEIITINATAEPVKVKPENHGGMIIPDQDKVVYNRIRTNDVNTKVENLFPEPEQPIMPNILAIEKNAPSSEFIAMDEVQSFDPLTQETVVEPVAKAETVAVPQKVEQVVLAEAQVVKVEVPKIVEKKITKTEATETKSVWTAQLMSSSNKQTVEKAWPKILAKHKALLSNMSYKIVKADIAGKGTFYRLQVGNFNTRDMANALCKKLKAQKQDCIPAK